MLKGCRDVMTTTLRKGKLNWPLERCARTMAKYGIRHLPIVSNEDRFLGLVSLADVSRFAVKARFPKEGETAPPDAALRDGSRAYFAKIAAFAKGEPTKGDGSERA
jgi:CBS-domain-containing membrane protein